MLSLETCWVNAKSQRERLCLPGARLASRSLVRHRQIAALLTPSAHSVSRNILIERSVDCVSFTGLPWTNWVISDLPLCLDALRKGSPRLPSKSRATSDEDVGTTEKLVAPTSSLAGDEDDWLVIRKTLHVFPETIRSCFLSVTIFSRESKGSAILLKDG